VLLCAILSSAFPGQSWAEDVDVQTTWQLLDYIAIDYAGAVDGGRVVNKAEYAEMTEFAGQVESQLGALPEKDGKAGLVRQATALRSAIDGKAAPSDVSGKSRNLAADLLALYPVPVAPRSAPDVGRGAALYEQNCASCHGASGNGRGPDAAGLDPPPIAFTDKARASERSLFGLYQVVTQGLDGTAMTSFADLPDGDRWALAFHAGQLAYSPGDAQRGQRVWRDDPDIRARVPDLKALVTITPAALGRMIGQDKADSVMAYLRAHPEVVTEASGGPGASLDIVQRKLLQSLAAYQRGDKAGAKRLALAAYLDGFEPVEPLLSVSDPALMNTIETRMGEFRAAIDRGVPPDTLSGQVDALGSLIADARGALSPEASSAGTIFLGAFTILLREGLEALLIVVAMLAFLRKAERTDALRYVHAGWVVALLAGGATWLVATYVIGISGASRELTEGFGSLLSAVVLLSVGIWMHGKSHADQWQRYIHEKLVGAINRQSGWFLFSLAFVVVYREVFETILFYAALWAQGSGMAMLAGAASASAVLAGVAWAMLRYSRALPVGTFFRYSSWLMAILTVVLAGKGVAALQEAGWIDIAPLSAVPRVSMLGLYPTVQSITAQVVAALAIFIGFAMTTRRSAAEARRPS
jgi:high-affinity iron transporter